jgi:hypothetical protein
VDEGLGLTSCGVGACARTVATCLNGTPQSCLPTGPAPTGRGLDGALSVASGVTTTINTVRTPVSGAAGTTLLSLGSAAGFSVGRLVLVHQSQGTGAGAYEIRQIRSLSGTTATIDTALLSTYSIAGSNRAQAVLVPEYTNVTVASGGTLVAPAWDGSTGGILVYLASGTVTIDGAVSMSGRGFRGTSHPTCFNRCITGVARGVFGRWWRARDGGQWRGWWWRLPRPGLPRGRRWRLRHCGRGRYQRFWPRGLRGGDDVAARWERRRGRGEHPGHGVAVRRRGVARVAGTRTVPTRAVVARVAASSLHAGHSAVGEWERERSEQRQRR